VEDREREEGRVRYEEGRGRYMCLRDLERRRGGLGDNVLVCHVFLDVWFDCWRKSFVTLDRRVPVS
jgi:hypothetical protein